MSAPTGSFPSISIAAPAVLAVLMLGVMGITVHNLRTTKIWALGWVIAYATLRIAAFILRIIISQQSATTPSEINSKITLLIVDSVLYTAGYFFLFNCVLSLVIRWVIDPLSTTGGHPSSANTGWTPRILRYAHLAIVAATGLSMYGGIELAMLPHTGALSASDLSTMDKSKTYRNVGVYLMLAVVVAITVVVCVKLATRDKSTERKRPGLYVLVCLCFLGLRAGLSLYFVKNPSKMTDEAVLYGLAIAPELPAVLLLCVPRCLGWFRYAPEVMAAMGAYAWVPGIIKNRLDKYNPSWNTPQTAPIEHGYPMRDYDSAPYKP